MSVENVSKKFCRTLKRSLWYGVRDVAGEMLLRRNKRAELRQDEFWALKDVSFELRQGEMLGLIGSNGAGKSTLLKLINGLIRLDTGCIRIRGRVGALIELGTGFNPILTGRENIYVNAAVLGLRREEVDRRLDEIIDFAEIGDFIDAPLQTYSSGMKVRLGFSVASHLNPDILLIDEILSVGDSSFRERCYARLTDYKKRGGTIIFVSHNPGVVEAVCDRVLWLDRGKVMALGKPADITDRYETQAREVSRQAALRISGDQIPEQGEDVFIKSVKCYDVDGHEKDAFEFGESFEVRIEFQASTEVVNPCFAMAFTKLWASSGPFYAVSMMADNTRLGHVVGEGRVSCLIKNPCMTPGEYSIMVEAQKHLSGELGKKYYAKPQRGARFEIKKDEFLRRYPSALVSKLLIWPPVALSYEWNLEQVPFDAGYDIRYN